ncbi:MAG: tyrosine-type recombinase/integrase [Actinobacteria bacterium]|nr:tyrosine-type recombinase/integrase [Actinomycetota bacterium]
MKSLPARNGRKWWVVRISYTDALTGKKKSSRRQIQADSRQLAGKERDRLIEKARGAASSDGKRHRVSEAIDLYLATIETHSTRITRTSHAKHLRAQFGEWWIDAVTTRHIQDFLDAFEQSVSSRKTMQAIMSLAFEEAIRRKWVTTNQAKGIVVRERRRAQGAKKLAPKRSLSLDEAVAYLADVKENESNELYLLLFTQLVLGCRFCEVTCLRWDEVDLESGIVTISHGQYRGVVGDTKGRYARQAALDLGLRSELKAHRRTMAEHGWPGWEELVFPRPTARRQRASNHFANTTVHYAIKRSFERLGLEMAVATHVARHTMLNVAREHGSALLLRKVMGHRSEAMQMTYTAAEKREVISIAERVGSALRSGTKSGTRTDRGGEDA